MSTAERQQRERAWSDVLYIIDAYNFVTVDDLVREIYGGVIVALPPGGLDATGERDPLNVYVPHYTTPSQRREAVLRALARDVAPSDATSAYVDEFYALVCQNVSIEDTVDSDNDFVTMWITELGQHRYQPTTPWGLRMWQGTVVDLHQYPSLRLRNWHLPDERICNSCPPDPLCVSEELCTWHEHSTVRQTYKPRMFASKKRAARLGRKAHKKWVALCKKRAGRSAQEVTW